MKHAPAMMPRSAFLDRLAWSCTRAALRLSLRHPWWVIFFSAAIAVPMLVCASRLQTDNSPQAFSRRDAVAEPSAFRATRSANHGPGTYLRVAIEWQAIRDANAADSARAAQHDRDAKTEVSPPSQADPSQPGPSQASRSQASPSQASPSQAGRVQARGSQPAASLDHAALAKWSALDDLSARLSMLEGVADVQSLTTLLPPDKGQAWLAALDRSGENNDDENDDDKGTDRRLLTGDSADTSHNASNGPTWQALPIRMGLVVPGATTRSNVLGLLVGLGADEPEALRKGLAVVENEVAAWSRLSSTTSAFSSIAEGTENAGPVKTIVTGMPDLDRALGEASEQIRTRWFPWMAFAASLLLLIALRSLRASIAGLLVVVLALCITMGSMQLAGISLNLVLAMLPPLIFAIALATVVHLLLAMKRAALRHGDLPTRPQQHADLASHRLQRWFRAQQSVRTSSSAPSTQEAREASDRIEQQPSPQLSPKASPQAYRQAYRQARILYRVYRDKGPTLVWMTLTTGAGFASLGGSEVQAIAQFGLLATSGCMALAGASLLFLPAWMMATASRRPRAHAAGLFGHLGIPSLLNKLTRLTKLNKLNKHNRAEPVLPPVPRDAALHNGASLRPTGPRKATETPLVLKIVMAAQHAPKTTISLACLLLVLLWMPALAKLLPRASEAPRPIPAKSAASGSGSLWNIESNALRYLDAQHPVRQRLQRLSAWGLGGADIDVVFRFDATEANGNQPRPTPSAAQHGDAPGGSSGNTPGKPSDKAAKQTGSSTFGDRFNGEKPDAAAPLHEGDAAPEADTEQADTFTLDDLEDLSPLPSPSQEEQAQAALADDRNEDLADDMAEDAHRPTAQPGASTLPGYWRLDRLQAVSDFARGLDTTRQGSREQAPDAREQAPNAKETPLHAVSFMDLLLHQASLEQAPREQATNTQPPRAATLEAQAAALRRARDPQALALMAYDGRETRVRLAAPFFDADTLGALEDRTCALAAHASLPAPTLEGDYAAMLQTQRYLLTTLGTSLLWTTIAVALLFLLLTGRLALTASAMAVNAFPLLVVFGAMNWGWLSLDIGTAMVASILLGLAVDDTLHTLRPYAAAIKAAPRRPERHADTPSNHRGPSKTQDPLTRILADNAPAYLGSACVLALGFGVCLLSPFAPTFRFGSAMLIGILAALIADLVLLPACLALEEKRHSKPTLAPVRPPRRAGQAPRPHR